MTDPQFSHLTFPDWPGVVRKIEIYTDLEEFKLVWVQSNIRGKKKKKLLNKLLGRLKKGIPVEVMVEYRTS